MTRSGCARAHIGVPQTADAAGCPGGERRPGARRVGVAAGRCGERAGGAEAGEVRCDARREEPAVGHVGGGRAVGPGRGAAVRTARGGAVRADRDLDDVGEQGRVADHGAVRRTGALPARRPVDRRRPDAAPAAGRLGRAEGASRRAEAGRAGRHPGEVLRGLAGRQGRGPHPSDPRRGRPAGRTAVEGRPAGARAGRHEGDVPGRDQRRRRRPGRRGHPHRLRAVHRPQAAPGGGRLLLHDAAEGHGPEGRGTGRRQRAVH